ncbi:hypothetical protein Tco_0491988 [Tanacetum coccineum]
MPNFTAMIGPRCHCQLLAARDANRIGDDNHTSGTGGRRTERVFMLTCICNDWAIWEEDGLTSRIVQERDEKVEAELGNLKVKIERIRVVITIAERQAEEQKGSLKITSETIKTTNDQETEHGWALYSRDGEKEPYGGHLNPYALNATITTTVPCAPIAQMQQSSAILLVTVGVREMPTMPTIRGALGQARNLLASSVEFKDTSRGNAQS